MNILVTGGGKGIGKTIAKELNIDGNNIFTCGRNENLLKSYENYCICDLSTKDGMQKLGNYITDNNIDILVNNAGEYIYSHIEEMEFSDIEHITKVNLEAPLYLISRAIPYMKSQHWGRIINIGSISGVMGEAGASIYSATKSGLIGATRALALELAEYGITVNTINPGWVDTDMGNSSAQEGDFTKEEITECIPQKRFISPSEIAGMVKYLISNEARGVTGQSINLCAGLTCGC